MWMTAKVMTDGLYPVGTYLLLTLARLCSLPDSLVMPSPFSYFGVYFSFCLTLTTDLRAISFEI